VKLGMNMLLWSTDVSGSEYDAVFGMLKDAGYDGVEIPVFDREVEKYAELGHRLGELGLDRLSTEGAAERSKAIAPDIAAPLIAAVIKTTGIVKLETIEPMIANNGAFRAALDELRILPLNPVAA